jgi:Nickel responsive protein SCO4226-like
MPLYVIERNLPGAGRLSPEELQAVSQRSCAVLRELGPSIQWVESYVTDDTIYCVYLAPSEEIIREHARRGPFPVNRISPVRRKISPLTAEGDGQPAARPAASARPEA